MTLRILLLVPLAVGMAGCASLGRSARVSPVSMAFTPAPAGCPYVPGIDKDDPRLAIDLSCFTFPGDRVNAYQKARGTDANARAARNELEGRLVKQADDICQIERGSMYAKEAATNAALSFVSTALSTVSTIVGGEQAKSILSGGAGLAGSTRDNLNANIYRNQIIPAITQAIETEKGRIFTDLQSKRSLSTSDYPVDEMIRLVNSYHQACSFERAVQVLLKATVNQEGVNAIIADRNYSARLASLREALEAAQTRKAQGNPEAGETEKQLEKAIRELELKRVGLAEQVQGTNLQNETP